MKKNVIVLLLMLLSSTSIAGKPNFVFLLVDDIGWGDLTFYGSKLHETPHIDSLGRDGMKFSQAYAACTVCSSSRAAILTGRYPGRTHLMDWIAGHNKAKAKLIIPKWKMFMDHKRVTLPDDTRNGWASFKK